MRNVGMLLNARWLGIMAAGVLLLPAGTLTARAEAPDALAKRIEQALSAAQRRIPTEPARAEQDLLEAIGMLEQLDRAAPDHARRANLRQQSEQVTARLQQRLGRPVGGGASAAVKPTASAKPPDATPAAAPSGLPAAVAQQFKRLQDTLDGAAAAMDRDQLQSAGSRLAQAQKLMDEIQSRHGSRIPAGDPEAQAATDRLTAVKARYDQAKSAADTAAAGEAEAQRQREALSGEWTARLAPFFDSKTDLYLAFGSTFNTAPEDRQTVFHAAYAKASKLMEEYGKVAFPHGKSRELTEMEQRLSGLLADYQAEAGRARVEEACRPWVEKLRPYVAVGAGSPKYLIDGIVLNEADIKARSALLEEARALWEEYGKASFPLGKTEPLQDLEHTLRQRLEDMPASLQRSRELISADVAKEFDRILADLEEDDGWKNDPSKLPGIVMERDVDGLRQALERYASTVPSSDSKLTSLRGKLERILESDRKNRAVRAERTFMRAERYAGADAPELRRKVESIVKEKTGATSVPRVSLSADAWREESVQEWTDSTRTQRRHRHTRSMIAQAAGKGADGKVFLHTVHLASDRQTNGSWGPLYGHVQWSDWMAEANIKK